MGLKLRDGINPDILRKYGFHLGKEDFGKERWCGDGIGYEYQADWYHKFLTCNEDTGEYGEGLGKIAYTDDDFDVPMVQISFRTDRQNELYIDCAPSSCTYHIEGNELEIIVDTIFQLTQDQLLEKI
jgi:hypothetical protein